MSSLQTDAIGFGPSVAVFAELSSLLGATPAVVLSQLFALAALTLLFLWERLFLLQESARVELLDHFVWVFELVLAFRQLEQWPRLFVRE